MIAEGNFADKLKLKEKRLVFLMLLLLLLLNPTVPVSDPKEQDPSLPSPQKDPAQENERRPQNSYLPQLMAVAGVTATGDQIVDAALQTAAASHFQGWFDQAEIAYSKLAAAVPTNRDAYLGMSYTMQLRGCDEAARALRTFLRLHREQGPIPR